MNIRTTKNKSIKPLAAQFVKAASAQPSPYLLQGVMEGLIDGVMIITDKGELIHANSRAVQICQLLSDSTACAIPQTVWRSCEALIESRQLYPQQAIIIEDEISSATGAIRIRVQWLTAEHLPQSYLSVTLENQTQSAQYRAIAEAIKYRLTARETEVWQLKRAGHSYKEIAAHLFLAENTVKKHIKNIHVKRAAAV